MEWDSGSGAQPEEQTRDFLFEERKILCDHGGSAERDKIHVVLQKLSFYFVIKLGAVYDRRMIFGGVHVDGDLISARNLPGIMLHGVHQLFPCLFFKGPHGALDDGMVRNGVPHSSALHFSELQNGAFPDVFVFIVINEIDEPAGGHQRVVTLLRLAAVRAESVDFNMDIRGFGHHRSRLCSNFSLLKEGPHMQAEDCNNIEFIKQICSDDGSRSFDRFLCGLKQQQRIVVETDAVFFITVQNPGEAQHIGHVTVVTARMHTALVF